MQKRKVRARDVRDHFDQLADSYDSIKNKNRYYYQSLKQTVQDIIPPGKRVLDIGMGTGEILNFLKPSKGVGIDLSSRFVEIARRKFPHLEFHAAPVESFETRETFDFILMADVIEHLESPEKLFINLTKLTTPGTQVVLTMANPLWEPILELLEKLKLKMAEGPCHRVSGKSVIKSAEEAHFRLVQKGYYLLVPFHIPGLSRRLNRFFSKVPLLRNFSVIQLLIFTR